MVAAGLCGVLIGLFDTSTKGLKWKQAVPRHKMKWVAISTSSAMPGIGHTEQRRREGVYLLK